MPVLSLATGVDPTLSRSVTRSLSFERTGDRYGVSGATRRGRARVFSAGRQCGLNGGAQRCADLRDGMPSCGRLSAVRDRAGIVASCKAEAVDPRPHDPGLSAELSRVRWARCPTLLFLDAGANTIHARQTSSPRALSPLSRPRQDRSIRPATVLVPSEGGR